MRPTTLHDILNSVEFELLQGTLPNDELGQGMARLRNYQNEQRAELFGAGAASAPTVESMADLQLRLNDAMLTLIQVLSARFDGLRAQVRQAEYLQLRLDETAPAPLPRPLPPTTPATYADAGAAHQFAAPADGSESELEVAVRACMRPDTLDQWLDVRPVNIPLIGGLLTKARRAMHELVIYYVRRLADEQAEINQTYGNALLVLEQAVRVQTALLQQQAPHTDDSPLPAQE